MRTSTEDYLEAVMMLQSEKGMVRSAEFVSGCCLACLLTGLFVMML